MPLRFISSCNIPIPKIFSEPIAAKFLTPARRKSVTDCESLSGFSRNGEKNPEFKLVKYDLIWHVIIVYKHSSM